MLSHGNLMASALLALAEGGFPRNSVYLHAAPMFHLANGCGMYCMLLNAGTNAIIKAFSPEAVAQAIERFHVSHTLLVPTMIQMLVDHQRSPGGIFRRCGKLCTAPLRFLRRYSIARWRDYRACV